MSKEIKDRLVGCIYTVFTAFTISYEIDYEAIGKYIDHLYETGARTFYVMPYNSRYSQLTSDEILSLNEFVIRRAKGLDQENLVVVGDPIHCSTSESIKFARHAREAGADVISLIVREKYFTDSQIIEHFATVGREGGLPILVHEMPFLSGLNGKQMHWPESLLNRLADVPEIIAIKEDAKDFQTACNILKLEPRMRVVMAGRKSSFIRYKGHGGVSYLNGISMLDARIGVKFSQAYKSGDQDTIEYIMHKIEAPFFDKCASKYGWHRTNKALLQAAGLMHRRDRMPLQSLNEQEYEEVVEVYHEIQPFIESLISDGSCK